MNSTAIVERFIREAWLGNSATALEETVSSETLKRVFVQFNSSFTDVELKSLGPLFSDADGSMVAFYVEMHIRQVAKFLDVEAIGARADVGATGICQLEYQRITKMWIEVDFAALYAQTER